MFQDPMRKVRSGLLTLACATLVLHSAIMRADDNNESEVSDKGATVSASAPQPADNTAKGSSDPQIEKAVSQRFAGETSETPDFRKHVVPLLGKLGCNGRACHGSFQGQGDFRLSRFGYDFKMDHEGLNDRIDTDAPADSYALQKPTLQEPHKGGKRMDVGSWEYKVFLNWIQAGARNVDESTPDLVRVDVEPKEMVFAKKGQTIQLRAVAVWSDGSQEDVTPLCRYQSNSEQVAEVN